MSFPKFFSPIYLNRKEDVLEAIECLETFYSDVEEIHSYVEWLKLTSKYCNIWELSI